MTQFQEQQSSICIFSSKSHIKINKLALFACLKKMEKQVKMIRDDSVSGTAIIYLFFLHLKSHPKHQQLCLVYASDNKLFKNSMTTLSGLGY